MAYTKWVYRVWDRLEQRTGHRPHYMTHDTIAGYCPACGVGTLSLTFRDTPPRMIVRTAQLGVGFCSEGCTEPMITEALFA